MRALKFGIFTLLLGTAYLLFAQELKNDGFAGSELSDYFKPCAGAEMIRNEENGGKNTVRLKDDNIYLLTSLPFKVEQLQRYTLNFKAQIKGPHVVEEVPMYAQLFFETEWAKGKKGQPLASWKVIFRDKDGKSLNTGYDQFFNTIMSSQMRGYLEEFRTPPETEIIEIMFKNANKGDSLLIEDMKISKVENPQTENINPDFSLGIDNFSGWNNCAKGRMQSNPEKEGDYMLAFFNPQGGGGVRSDAIPVTPGEDYRIEYSFSSNPENGKGSCARIVVFYYKDYAQRWDCQNGQVTRVFMNAGNKKNEGKYSFVVPEGMLVMRVMLENGIFDYARIIHEKKQLENNK